MEHSATEPTRENVLRTREAAKYVGLKPQTLAHRRVKGKPPRFIKLGGKAVGYLIADLDEWLESCRRDSTSEAA